MADIKGSKQQLTQLQTEEEIDKYFQDQAHFMMAKRKIETIDNFNGVFDFLNNEYPCTVYFEGRLYPSVFHAFQAARSEKDHERAKISMAESLQELYELATEIEDPTDWVNKRLTVMERCLRDKFRRHRELRDRLRKTGNRELINTYSDRTSSNLFWGMVDGKGQNHLGTLLQNIRLDIHTEKELQKWLSMTFDLETDKMLLPKIKLDIKKQDNLVGVETLKRVPYNIFGILPTCDVVVTHPSTSRQHLAILVDKKLGVVLVDLGSKAGSILNGDRVNPHIPMEIKKADWFGIAESTRTYTVNVDYAEVTEFLDKKHRNLQMDLKILSLQQNLSSKEDVMKAGLGLIKQDTVFLSNLPENSSDKEIREAFEQFGKIADVRLPINVHTGKPKSIAFVRFETEEEAKAAFQAVMLPIRDRLVKILFAEKNKGQLLMELEKETKRTKGRQGSDREGDRVEKDYRRRHKRSKSKSRSRSTRSDRRKSHRHRSTSSKRPRRRSRENSKHSKNRRDRREEKSKRDRSEDSRTSRHKKAKREVKRKQSSASASSDSNSSDLSD
jgi:RNA recognition motif-containing protein/predicted NAD-dependent protein-ADP-ribosyltransferase YbiA (DUF1768 family)